MIDFKNKENRFRIITACLFILYFIYDLITRKGILMFDFSFEMMFHVIIYIIARAMPLLFALAMLIKKNKIFLTIITTFSLLYNIIYISINIIYYLSPLCYLVVIIFNALKKKCPAGLILGLEIGIYIALIIYDFIETHNLYVFEIEYYIDIIFFIALRVFLSIVLIIENKEFNQNKEKLSFEEGYYELALHIIFTIFFGFIYKWVWIHRTTKYLNNTSGYEKRSPMKKTLLCIFVPFYTIYWTYQSAKRVEKLGKDKNIEYTGDFTSVAIILEILLGLVSPIYIQNRINNICLITKENNNSENKTKKESKNNNFDEIREYKKLLDEEIITQEEFNKKKKELLNI